MKTARTGLCPGGGPRRPRIPAPSSSGASPAAGARFTTNASRAPSPPPSPAAERPDLTAMIGFRCATSGAMRANLRGFPKLSRYGGKGEVDHPGLERAGHDEAAPGENLQHPIVLAQHVGPELGDAVGACEADE